MPRQRQKPTSRCTRHPGTRPSLPHDRRRDPSRYDDNRTHVLSVVVSDAYNHTATARNVFRVDGAVRTEDLVQDVGLFSEWVIQANFPLIFMGSYEDACAFIYFML